MTTWRVKNKWLFCYKEPICSAKGLECYRNAVTNDEMCMTACEGLYADVSKNNNYNTVEDAERFVSILRTYEYYKKGFGRDITYPKMLEGNDLIFVHNLYIFLLRLQDEEVQATLG